MFIKNFSLNFLNFLLIIFPITLILGNFATNLNTLIIILIGIFFFKNEIFIIKDKLLKYSLQVFFLYIIIITFINNFSFQEFAFVDQKTFLKSILFLRYLILFLVLKKLTEDRLLNLKYFYISSTICVSFLSFDIIFQVINNENILGYPIIQNRPSGFFGNELIAGNYIQKFSLFFLASIFLLKNKLKNNKIINFVFLISVSFFFITILLTNNRMSLILFFSSIILFLILRKKIFYLLVSTLIISIIFSLLFFNNSRLKDGFGAFYFKTLEIFTVLPELIITSKTDRDLASAEYLKLFNTGFQIWKENKVFGYGIKSFRKKCVFSEYQLCSTHPHNYYIEILAELGLLGLVLFFIFYINIIFYYLKLIIYEQNITKNFLFIPFFLIVFIEMIPIRSSGSFFSTSNATIFFLFLGILAGMKSLRKNN